MNRNLKIDRIEIFEWYDGLVLGLSCAGDFYFLVCLLAFDPNTMQKRYLLASISQNQAKQISVMFQKSGVLAFDKSAISKTIIESVNLYLTPSEPEEGKAINLTTLVGDHQEHLQNLSFPLIDAAVAGDAISHWLGN